MDNKDFKYNAFISYRHNDLDKYVAESLQKLIETYKMPKSVIEKYNITDNNYRRVFRDQDELPLSANLEDPIIDALENSQFLIVICSPRLKESKWCKKEIESFIKMHGRNNILCVLVEGEPDESFPEILKYREEKVVTKTGKERVKKVPNEPLAMDVRGGSKKEIYNNLKRELIRAIAPMYNLDYDDIKRRHEERELKHKANVFKTVAVISIIFALYSFFLFSNIYISSNKLKYDQSINLAEEAHELLSNDNRKAAVLKSYQSVTKYNNNSMPVTAKGMYELTDSLGLYYHNNYFYPVSQLDTLGKVDSIKRNKDSLLLSFDSSGELVLWNLEKEKRIQTITNTRKYFGSTSYTFVGDDRFAYINDSNEVVIMDLKGNEIKKITYDSTPTNIVSSINGKYLEVDNGSHSSMIETSNYKEIGSFTIPESEEMISGKSFDDKEENFVFTTETSILLPNRVVRVLTYNLNEKKFINSYVIDADNVNKMILEGENSIILMKKKNDSAYNTILMKYNYKTGQEIFRKHYDRQSPNGMEINIANKNNKTIFIATDNRSYLLDYDNGYEKKQYSLSNEIATIKPFDSGEYGVFTQNGHLVSVKASDSKYNDSENTVWYMNVFNANLSNYKEFMTTKYGYLGYVQNDNRIIIYNLLNENEKLKEIEYKQETIKTISSIDGKKIAEEYNNMKKNLVSNVFYSDDNSIIFIVYSDDKMEIYDTKTKKMLNEVEMLHDTLWLNHYIGKTESGEHLIRNYLYDGYILNKNFELIAYVPGLVDYKDKKLILTSNDKYYEIKMYSQKEIIEKGKKYLESINNE